MTTNYSVPMLATIAEVSYGADDGRGASFLRAIQEGNNENPDFYTADEIVSAAIPAGTRDMFALYCDLSAYLHDGETVLYHGRSRTQTVTLIARETLMLIGDRLLNRLRTAEQAARDTGTRP